MTLILPLLSILGFSAYFSNIFRVKFTFVLPAVISLLIFILFISSAAQILYHTTAVIIVLGIIAQIYSLYKFSDFRKIIMSYRYELSTLTIISIFYALFTRKIHLNAWDDFGFWIIFTKELMFYNDIYPHNIATAIIPTHIHYPRGASLFHYFILYFTKYSESKILISHYLLQMLFLAPITASKHSWQTIILLGLLFLFPVTYGYALFSTYNDGMIGIIFSSTIIIFILSQDKHEALYLISPIIAFMPLFREIGLLLAQLAVVIMLVTLWMLGNKKTQGIKKHSIWICISLLILPYLTQYVWFEYIASNEIIVGRKEHSFSNLSSIILALFDSDSKALQITIAYIKAAIKTFISPLFIVMYVLQIATWLSIIKYKDNNLKHEFKIILTTSIVCFIIFLAWRLYIYLLLASSVYSSGNNLINLKCIGRYVISYGVVFFAIPCAFLKITILDKFKFSDNYNKIIAVIMLLAAIFLSYVLDLKKVMIKDLSVSEQMLRSQTNIVRDLASKNFVIDYDFNFNKIIHDGTKELVCTKIIALLVPYAGNDLRKQCVNQHPSGETSKLEMRKNQTSSNINIEDIDKLYNQDGCKVIYHPLINNLDINCS